MGIVKGRYNKKAPRNIFHGCCKCGKKFKEGDIIWKKTKKVKTFHKISSYWCESCYDALFIDV